MDKEIANGSRVRVKIRDYGRYAFGCAEKLDGATGVAVETNPRSINGDEWLGPAVLVEFDKPAGTWWAHQSPPKAFWFPPKDLELM